MRLPNHISQLITTYLDEKVPIFIRIELFDKNSIRLLEKVSKTIKAIFELKFLPKMEMDIRMDGYDIEYDFNRILDLLYRYSGYA